MDTTINQIRRYSPQEETYPDRPDNYFTIPPRSLAEAQDMAIDGSVYILFNDGVILKFLGGEPKPFDISNLPGDLTQAVALAVDPNGSSGVLYVADAGNRRVVALGSDGSFRAQFRAEGALDALETLAVDEAGRRLYVISGGKLYVASLP
jgi:outer membrane protein assembly factor BamB